MKNLMIIVIFILITIVAFSTVYLTYSKIEASNYIQNKEDRILTIGVKQEFILNDYFSVGFDASYLSPGIKIINNIPYFDKSYASYDAFVVFEYKSIKIQITHNCTHYFKTSPIHLLCNDHDTNSVTIEYLY